MKVPDSAIILIIEKLSHAFVHISSYNPASLKASQLNKVGHLFDNVTLIIFLYWVEVSADGRVRELFSANKSHVTN
jgi:hypothetical protein